MQINNMSNNDTNFKRLYMPKTKGVLSLKNTYNSVLFDWVREPLEEMAQDVDIYVRPRGLFNRSFDIKVGRVEKSPLKRFFGFIGETINKKLKEKDKVNFNGTLAELILSKTKEAKEEFIGFQDYLTKS